MADYGFCKTCNETVEVAVLPQDRPQWRVAKAVAVRGCRNGWTAPQFMARQAARLQEEVGELACMMVYLIPSPVLLTMKEAADMARAYSEMLDHQLYWKSFRLQPEELRRIADKLADMQVVMFNLAATLEAMMDEPVDVVALAVEKAEKDIDRGIGQAKPEE